MAILLAEGVQPLQARMNDQLYWAAADGVEDCVCLGILGWCERQDQLQAVLALPQLRSPPRRGLGNERTAGVADIDWTTFGRRTAAGREQQERK